MNITFKSRKISKIETIPAGNVREHTWTTVQFTDGSLSSTISEIKAIVGDWIGFDGHGCIWVKQQ